MRDDRWVYFVKNYTSSIYTKIGIHDRSKAILLLREILKG
jgi:DNA-binding NarL/FixJ family response regulator